jgi:hypothetical protein
VTLLQQFLLEIRLFKANRVRSGAHRAPGSAVLAPSISPQKQKARRVAGH